MVTYHFVSQFARKSTYKQWKNLVMRCSVFNGQIGILFQLSISIHVSSLFAVVNTHITTCESTDLFLFMWNLFCCEWLLIVSCRLHLFRCEGLFLNNISYVLMYGQSNMTQAIIDLNKKQKQDKRKYFINDCLIIQIY